MLKEQVRERGEEGKPKKYHHTPEGKRESGL